MAHSWKKGLLTGNKLMFPSRRRIRRRNWPPREEITYSIHRQAESRGLDGLSEPEPTNGFALELPSPPLSSLRDDKKKRWMRRVDDKEQKAQVAEMTVKGKIFPLALMASSCSLATRLSWRTTWQNREDPRSVIYSAIEKNNPVNHLPFEGAGKRSQEQPVKWRCQKKEPWKGMMAKRGETKSGGGTCLWNCRRRRLQRGASERHQNQSLLTNLKATSS